MDDQEEELGTPSRATVAWLALAIAFVIHWWVPVQAALLQSLFDPAAVARVREGMEALGAVLALTLVPVLVYVLLRVLHVEAWLRIPAAARGLLVAGGVFAVLPAAVGSFSALAQGGSSLAAVLGPAVWLARLLYFMAAAVIVIQTVRERGGVESRGRPFNAGEFVAAVLILAVPAACVGYLMLAEESPVRTAMRANKAFEARCRQAGEWITRQPTTPVEGLFIERDANVAFEQVRANGSYRTRGGGLLGAPMVNNGQLVFFEKPARAAEGAAAPARYTRHRKSDWKGETIDRIESEYGLYHAELTTPEERDLGLRAEELVVRHVPSGGVLARAVYVEDPHAQRYCGPRQDGRFSTANFVERVLQLEKPAAAGKGKAPAATAAR